ncbi:MAG: phasin family protein [Pseudomonadota bacterium]
MADKATDQVEAFTAEAQKTVEESVEKMTKTLETTAGFGQQNFDAVVESGRIAAKAAEGINAELMALSKKSYEDGLAAAKDLSSAKSITELLEKQTAITKSTMDTMIAGANKMADLYTVAAKDAMAPLTARATATTDYFRTIGA